MNPLAYLRDKFQGLAPEPAATGELPSLMVDDLDAWGFIGQQSLAPWSQSYYDGDKFAGGFGETQLQTIDYWTLRARSAQVFNENHYARGIIRRFITNVINTGLTPEACPEEEVLGMQPDELAPWTDTVESRFGLWASNPRLCDWKRLSTFGAIQRAAYLEALVSGDVLVVSRMNRQTGLPSVQLISGSSVRTPYASNSRLRPGHEIQHGVEFDAVGRQVAFWVQQNDGDFKRLPAYGEKSGRRLAWLVYATEKRLDEVRGVPLLGIVLQSLKEIDRYRDSTQRKALINSMLALFIKKTSDAPGTLPMTGGAVRRDSVSVSDSTTAGVPRKFNVGSYYPGMIIDELQEGEEPVLKGGEGTDVNFGPFEDAIISSIAWALEMPPEILRLSFSNNYSASAAAINEVKIAINLKWGDWGETFCAPIYQEWLISEALLGKIRAPGLLAAWRDPLKQEEFSAWASADWYGSIKPSTDVVKQAKGSAMLLDKGLTTYAREARVLTGTKFSKNVKRLARENQQLADATRPLLELRQQFGTGEVNSALQEVNDRLESLEDNANDAQGGAA